MCFTPDSNKGTTLPNWSFHNVTSMLMVAEVVAVASGTATEVLILLSTGRRFMVPCSVGVNALTHSGSVLFAGGPGGIVSADLSFAHRGFLAIGDGAEVPSLLVTLAFSAMELATLILTLCQLLGFAVSHGAPKPLVLERPAAVLDMLQTFNCTAWIKLSHAQQDEVDEVFFGGATSCSMVFFIYNS